MFGYSGSGKSTFTALVRDACQRAGLSSACVKLADPLYRLQRQVYAAAGITLRGGEQDQLLMENLAAHLRRLNPRSFADDFLHRLGQTEADVVLNDDLRDPHIDAADTA